MAGVLVTGLTDVWSAIRRGCNRMFEQIAELFTMTEVCVQDRKSVRTAWHVSCVYGPHKLKEI